VASNVRQLLDEIRGCRICADSLPMGPRPVLQLHPAARILVAGQAPGRAVHRTGIPFDDRSGERLRSWLGVTNEEFYDERLFAVVPMGFCYPGSGRSGDLPPRPECSAAWRQRVLGALRSLRLTVVVGQYAIAHHLPGSGSVTQAARSWRLHAPELFPLPHPSPRNARWMAENDWFSRDVVPALRRRVRQVLRRDGGRERVI